MRKFQTNDKNLEILIKEKFGEKENPQNENETKVLGVHWDKKIDQITFKIDEIRKRFESDIENITKREVLKNIASIYDPLGLINPIVVSFKAFFQKLNGMKNYQNIS